jgi:arylsulfatase A-like enzyme
MLLACACSHHDVPPEVQIDLLHVFPYTDSGQETAEIDLAAAGAEAYLVRGWSPPETLPTGEAMVRAVGRNAMLRFAVSQPAERRLQLHCGIVPPRSQPSHPQPVMLQLNGRSITQLKLQDGFEEYTVQLPIQAQRVGENMLGFMQRTLPRGARDRGGNTRPALACNWIRFQNADGSTNALPRLIGNGGSPTAVALPAPSHVSYFLRLPDAAALAFELTTADGDHAPHLSVSVQRDNGTAEVVWPHDGSARAAHVDLGRFAGEIVRLDFTAEGHGSLQVVRPRVIGRATGRHSEEPEKHQHAERLNVVLYLIDTLRADHLGSYGYPLPTSPNIDALAADAVVFTRTQAQASWTRPATGSILTGLYPYAHGAVSLRDRLRPGAATLAELLRAHGYQTAAFVTNVNVGGGFGFDRGFDQFTYLPEDENRPSLHVRSDAVNEVVCPWLQAHTEEPFLLYVHVSDPHAPYTPPDQLDERFRDAGLTSALAGRSQPVRRLLDKPELITPENLRYLQSLYDGEIAFTDQNFGKLVSQLKQLGLYERTIIVLMADHGEEFYEHGAFEHGYTLYAEQLAVPLLMRVPGSRYGARRVACLARQIDVLPTLLELLGIAVPPDVQGRSLLPQIDGDCVEPESFAQTSLSERTERRAVIANGWKLIDTMGARSKGPELYELESDPHEQHDLAEQRPLLLGYGRQSIRQWAADVPRPTGAAQGPAPTIGAETMERLRALGYAP